MKISMSLATFLVILVCCFEQNVEGNLRIPSGMKQDDYCEYCELAVKGIVKFNSDKKTNWIESSPCLEKYFKKSAFDSATLKKIVRTCNHLLDLYGDELEKVSPGMNQDQLSVWLCHEKSYACLGLVHQKHDGSAVNMNEDEEIKNLIRQHKDKIKTPYPYHYKEEL